MNDTQDFIGGFAVDELLKYLRDLEAHGHGEVIVSAHDGRFLVREAKSHKPREDKRLTR
jgi:hypothetical protein